MMSGYDVTPLLYLADDGRQFGLVHGVIKNGRLEVSTEVMTAEGALVSSNDSVDALARAIAMPAEIRAKDGRLVRLVSWCPRIEAGEFVKVSFTGELDKYCDQGKSMIKFSYDATTGHGSFTFSETLNNDLKVVSAPVVVEADFDTLHALHEMIRKSTAYQVSQSLEDFRRRAARAVEGLQR